LSRFLLLAVVLGISCAAAPPTPTESTTLPTTGSSSQSPSASVHATGTVTFSSCTPDGKCEYQGTITNDGPDCASNVRGVTHLLDATGKDIESQSWEILGRVRRGDTPFSGCCFLKSSVDGHRSVHTDVTSEPLPCI
jgi:hypothetical protein